MSADSQHRDAILTEEILHLDFLHHLKVSETANRAQTTVSSSLEAKITVAAIDINIFPPVAGPRRLSFVCLFSFWNCRLCCAKVAFVCDDPTEWLS